jgi:hypothetical protein
MSTGLECSFVEVKPGEWWYLLESGFAPKNAWDWREFADAYGPFKTEDEASEHLRKNHANPGGSSLCPYEDGYQPDDVMKKLMEEARDRDKLERAARAYRPPLRRW